MLAQLRRCGAFGVDGKVRRLEVVEFQHLGVYAPTFEGQQDWFKKGGLQLN
jgi:hypothetical protein